MRVWSRRLARAVVFARGRRCYGDVVKFYRRTTTARAERAWRAHCFEARDRGVRCAGRRGPRAPGRAGGPRAGRSGDAEFAVPRVAGACQGAVRIVPRRAYCAPARRARRRRPHDARQAHRSCSISFATMTGRAARWGSGNKRKVGASDAAALVAVARRLMAKAQWRARRQGAPAGRHDLRRRAHRREGRPAARAFQRTRRRRRLPNLFAPRSGRRRRRRRGGNDEAALFFAGSANERNLA